MLINWTRMAMYRNFRKVSFSINEIIFEKVLHKCILEYRNVYICLSNLKSTAREII